MAKTSAAKKPVPKKTTKSFNLRPPACITMAHQKTVIIIVGPTAVGKTAFALEMARLLDTGIISADSRQCYRELNIGVAKPTEAELRDVKHYFINSHSIHEEVNAAVFEAFALQTLDQIFAKRDVAVMVGGTGLYIRSFTSGLDEIPSVDEDVRQQVITDYQSKGLEWLQAEVRQADPQFWAQAEQQNPQRLMRALEVARSTGMSITAFRKGEKKQRPFRMVTVGLELPRAELYQRINTRVDQMVRDGLVEEARALAVYRHLPALQTVGYRELFDYFDGECSLDQAVEEIKKNSRHYAKRQLTWFRRDPDTRWFPAPTPATAVLEELDLANQTFDKR